MGLKQKHEAIRAVMQTKPRWALLVTPSDPDTENGVEYHNGVLSFVQGGVKISLVDVAPEVAIEALKAMTNYSFSGLNGEALDEHSVIVPGSKPEDDSVLSLRDYIFFNKIEDDIYIFQSLGPSFDGEVKRLEELRDKRTEELKAEEEQEAVEDGVKL